ncbi:50S ribosomal protein L27 [Alphaproteobacteria bacterium]|nr:50S ribosomal protein L27 [Alphaproteobacteria bacterium]
MAHHKGSGAAESTKHPIPKNLGVKKFGGEKVVSGNIIVRQRGTKYHPGSGVGCGRDYTLFATADGHVAFRKGFKGRTFVSVAPAAS